MVMPLDYDVYLEDSKSNIINNSPQNLPINKVEDDSTIAKEIPGIEKQIPSPTANEDPIEFVYANSNTDSKGLVVLLHGCSHSAFKFFSPSPSTCPHCIGLAEELRIVRLIVERGYTPLAISSIDRKKGCWSNRDVTRIKAVLQQDLFRDHRVLFSIGASSGGFLAAELAAQQIVQGALVLVMGLNNGIVDRLKKHPVPIYLAPMPRDKNTMKNVAKNYRDLESVKEYVTLDETSCVPLPVTTAYLVQRVPGMTIDPANELISKLKNAKHIDSTSDMLIVNPTTSDWRKIVSPTNTQRWLDIFDLTPGYSPLAKALHRAWAFHEYCSETVVPALEFFEGHQQKL